MEPSVSTDRWPTGPVVAAAADELARAGVASARVDAEWLAAHVLGVARGRLAVNAGFTARAYATYRDLVAARARRVPLQHLVGTAGFRWLDLAVGPGVFVPRPETELLVDWGLARLRSAGPAPIVVDLCAGSGAIALAVAHEAPHSRTYAVERAPQALRWLRRNASARQAAGDPEVTVVAADATDPATLSILDGQVDLVLCNPPYVPDGTPLPPEVADHDPGDAVFGGPDGLAVIRPVIARAAVLLRPGGWLGVEHDDTHGEAVPALLAAHRRYTGIEDHRDLAGLPRFATARVADCTA